MFYVEHGYPNELYHFGIKGMKWGVRRYQNKDGSLTTAGARRYNDAKGAYKNAKSEYRQARRAYTKSYDKAYGYSARHPVSQFIGKSRKAASAVGRAGKKVGNRILDEVDPIYAVNQTTHRRRKIRRG